MMTSTFIQSQTASAASSGARSWPAALMQSVMRQLETIRLKRQIYRDLDDLFALNDRMLADIGLTRDDVEHAARHGRLPTQAADRAAR